MTIQELASLLTNHFQCILLFQLYSPREEVLFSATVHRLRESREKDLKCIVLVREELGSGLPESNSEVGQGL